MKSTGIVFEGQRYWSLDSTEPPATALADVSRFGNDGSMTASKPDWVKLSSGLWVMSFNGADAVVDVGNIGQNMKTFLAWIYPDDNTTRSIADFDGGTISLELDASGDLTATGWTAPTRYVNAAVANAVTQSAWSFIAITTATAIDVSDFDIGKEASYFDGYMSPPVLINYALSLDKIQNIYESERRYFGK